MARADDARRVDVGFIAGQVLSLRLAESDYRDFVKALQSDGGWQRVKTEDAEIVLDTNKVAYVRVATEEHKVGFAGK